MLLVTAQRRDEAAARGRDDVAHREERRLERLRRLRASHAELEFAAGLNVLVLGPAVEPSMEQCFLFCGGRLVGQRALPRRLPQRDEARAALAQLLCERYRPSQAPRSFTRQEEIDQVAIVAAWYRDRRDGLCYIDLPSEDPSEATAARWACKILDGESLDVAGEIPEDEREQEREARGHRVEEDGGPGVIVSPVLGFAG